MRATIISLTTATMFSQAAAQLGITTGMITLQKKTTTKQQFELKSEIRKKPQSLLQTITIQDEVAR